MLRKLCFILFSFVFFTNTAISKDIVYDKIDIPGAVCGSGLQYHVFVNKDSMQDDGVLFYLESGGACWSWDTCWGPNFRTWIHPLPFPRIRLGKFKKKDIFENYTSVIFPYCTGDIFGANYKSKYKVNHVGKKNLELAIDYLKAKNILKPKAYQSLVVAGSSAGAIGALINANMFEKVAPNAVEKSLIMDSPGLHWGKKFWKKFDPIMIQQFIDSTSHILNDLTSHKGMVVKHLPKICRHFRDWNVGILQSTKDIIMSGLFGNVSPKNHKSTVYGPEGVYQQSLGINNCAAWTPNSYGHAFLQLDPLQVVEADQVDSIEFVENIVFGKNLQSYKDH